MRRGLRPSSYLLEKIMNNWIKTSERLPVVGQEVLFVDERFTVHCGYFTDDWYSFSKGNWYGGEDITHWQPYPELPNEVE